MSFIWAEQYHHFDTTNTDHVTCVTLIISGSFPILFVRNTTVVMVFMTFISLCLMMKHQFYYLLFNIHIECVYRLIIKDKIVKSSTHEVYWLIGESRGGERQCGRTSVARAIPNVSASGSSESVFPCDFTTTRRL